MTGLETAAVLLLAAILIVYPAIGVLMHRAHRRRAGWNRHVDEALGVLGTRRPQDTLEERWPT